MKSPNNPTTQFIRHIAKKDFADAKKSLESIVEAKIRGRVQESLRKGAK
jgi:hypothetical protein